MWQFFILKVFLESFKLAAVDLSRQKELNADPKAIQQIETSEQLNNEDGIKADGTESMVTLMILGKIKETR